MIAAARPRSFVRFRSPLRSVRLTSILGAVLLVGIPVVAVTGLLSHAAYNPALGRNNVVGDPGIFDFYVFDWPTSPSWLYAATQGVHVTLGIALVPHPAVQALERLPKLFARPPVASPAQVLERLSIALLVGGALFEFITGISTSSCGTRGTSGSSRPTSSAPGCSSPPSSSTPS